MLQSILKFFVPPGQKRSYSKLACAGENKRIKVLRVISRMNIGGPAIHVSLLTKYIDNKRFDTKLVTGTISKSEGDMSYLLGQSPGTVIKIPELQREINPRKDVVAFFKILKIIIREKPDIVHTHMAKAGTIARLAVLTYNIFYNRKIKLVHTFHGNVLGGYFGIFKSATFNLIERFIAKFTDVIIAISQSQKWELSHKFSVTKAEKLKTVKLGIDLSKFTSIEKPNMLKKSLRLGEDTALIGIVGRLVPIKNHFMFIKAAFHLLSSDQRKKYHFIIIGDGEIREKLEFLTRELNVNDNIHFIGWRHDLPLLYADLDVVALTSLNEGTPVSIIEAMASAVPVITTDVGGVKDLLGNCESKDAEQNGFQLCERGLLCPKNDAFSLANGIRYIIEDESFSKKSSMVLNARNFIFENYSRERLVKDIESLYENLAFT
jgi:glycosyltransferase involved in cell wall biosynthesis